MSLQRVIGSRRRVRHPHLSCITSSTPEQEAAALLETERVLVQLRDTCRKLDLPGDAINVAFSIYYDQLSAVMAKDEEQIELRRELNITALRNHQRDNAAKNVLGKFGVGAALERGSMSVLAPPPSRDIGNMSPAAAAGYFAGGFAGESPDLLDEATDADIAELVKANGISV